MAKTRAQTRDLGIKKEEEEEEDRKPTLLLHGGNNTRTHNKVAKRKPSKRNNRSLPVQQVKVEEDTDTKSLLQSGSKSSKLPKGKYVSQEQINQLISAIANDNMSITEAAQKAKISYTTGLRYYKEYKNDPEKKIPSPRNHYIFPTQQHIKNLIRYIKNGKMSLTEASAKAGMSYQSGHYYYNRYLKDPDHKIPIPQAGQRYTQDQKNEFIGYIVKDKMTIMGASKKAKMSEHAGRKYYHKYFNDQNPDIPTPSHITTVTHHTQEQIKEVIGYIVNDKMTVSAASRKANISYTTTSRHYRRYLKNNNMELPASRNIAQDKINQLIGYIVDNKMSRKAASKKASMGYSTGNRYYHRYLKENNIRPPSFKYTQDQKNEFIGYIIDDGMTVKTASKKANIHYASGEAYYRKYRKEHNLDSPALKCRQDKIRELAGYVINDKMSMKAATKKANIHYSTGAGYHRQYLKDQKRDASN